MKDDEKLILFGVLLWLLWSREAEPAPPTFVISAGEGQEFEQPLDPWTQYGIPLPQPVSSPIPQRLS